MSDDHLRACDVGVFPIHKEDVGVFPIRANRQHLPARSAVSEVDDSQVSSNKAPERPLARQANIFTMTSNCGRIDDVNQHVPNSLLQTGLGPLQEHAMVHAASRELVADAEKASTATGARKMPTANSQIGARSQDSSSSIVTHVRHCVTAASSSDDSDLQDCEELELSETLQAFQRLHRILSEVSTQNLQGPSDSSVAHSDTYLAEARLRPRYAARQRASKLQSSI